MTPVLIIWALLALEPLGAGDQAPLVDLVDLQGHPVSLEPAGQVVIVDFFATWCPSCRRSLVDYGSLVDALGNRARLVLVDVKEPAAVVRAFFARAPLPAGVVLARDPRGATMRRFGATAFPWVFVIDPGGTVRRSRSGWSDASALSLVATVKEILAGPPRETGRVSRSRGAPARSRGRAPAETTEISADERARRMGVEILH
jgi:thiol-disulfide isomerase/thioredoxin